eukprot:770871-Amphidinium_carterae.1
MLTREVHQRTRTSSKRKVTSKTCAVKNGVLPLLHPHHLENSNVGSPRQPSADPTLADVISMLHDLRN